MKNTYNVAAVVLLLIALFLDRDVAAVLFRLVLVAAAALCGYRGWKLNQPQLK